MSARDSSQHETLELDTPNVNVTITVDPSKEELPPMSKVSMGPYAEINRQAAQNSMNGGLKNLHKFTIKSKYYSLCSCQRVSAITQSK